MLYASNALNSLWMIMVLLRSPDPALPVPAIVTDTLPEPQPTDAAIDRSRYSE